MLVAVGVFLLLGAQSTTAWAQDACPVDLFAGPKEVTPTDSAQGVTLDAPVLVRYSLGYFEEPRRPASLVVLEDDTESMVEGSTAVLGDVLVFQSSDSWLPLTTYRVQADGRDGSREFRFTTGTVAADQGPPVLGQIEDVTSSEVGIQCDLPEGGYRVDVSFPPATDDGPLGSIEYYLYVTRGPSIETPLLKARTRNFATDQMTMPFVLTPEQAVAPLCVSVHAVDGVGHIDDDGAVRCFDPIQGNFFQPLCSASPAARGKACVAAFFALALVSVAHRTRARRR